MCIRDSRYMHAGGIVDAYNKEITVWGFDDLKDDLNPEWIGLKAVSYTHLDVYKRQHSGRAGGAG